MGTSASRPDRRLLDEELELLNEEPELLDEEEREWELKPPPEELRPELPPPLGMLLTSCKIRQDADVRLKTAA